MKPDIINTIAELTARLKAGNLEKDIAETQQRPD